MTPDELELALEEASAEVAAAAAALAPKHVGGEMERFARARARHLQIQRDLARSRNEACAVALEWPVPWDVGAPLPLVLASERRVFVVYRRSERGRDVDVANAEAVDPRDAEQGAIAVVEFRRCLVHELGPPNDEAIEGHPLHGRGLEAYRAHVVERSAWLAELERMNRVHRAHRAERYAQLKHYVLAFHDETFECIAEDYVVRESAQTFDDAIRRCGRELLA